MSAGRKRRKRATLRGWWAPMPFLLVIFTILFAFTWLEVMRLKNTYKSMELREQIREVEAKIERLREDERTLERIDRMIEEAQDLDLRKAEPGQIETLVVSGEAPDQEASGPQKLASSSAPGARAVRLRLDAGPTAPQTDELTTQ